MHNLECCIDFRKNDKIVSYSTAIKICSNVYDLLIFLRKVMLLKSFAKFPQLFFHILMNFLQIEQSDPPVENFKLYFRVVVSRNFDYESGDNVRQKKTF